MQTLVLRDIYESNQNKQAFSLCLLLVFVVKIMEKTDSYPFAINLTPAKETLTPPSPPPARLNNKLLQSMPSMP